MHGLELLCNSTGASTGIEFARGGGAQLLLVPKNILETVDLTDAPDYAFEHT